MPPRLWPPEIARAEERKRKERVRVCLVCVLYMCMCGVVFRENSN